MLERIGARTAAGLGEAADLFAFVVDALVGAGRVIRQPRALAWRVVPDQIERVGFDGLPVIFLINFLVGMSLAFQSSGFLEWSLTVDR